VQDTAETIYSETRDMDTLGGRLSRARDATGLSVSELARRIGVQASTIKTWESDRAQPRANRLSMLAGVLNVSPSWLLHGVGEAPRESNLAEIAEMISAQLDRLKRLQAESAAIISQLESDLNRVNRQS
jgi:HTH-type transcriptional regulator, cell division transcriptional repressor